MLYVVPTPVGNLEDITLRAIRILREADFVLAEDTRTSAKLLKHLDIQVPMFSHHKFNEHKTVGSLAERIANSEHHVALISDAGTPAISDPGEDIVAQCAEVGIDVVPVPGPCAFVQALIISGLPTGRFSFEGFLSVNKKSRREHLKSAAKDTHTLIFYEAPHKLTRTLEDMYKYFGNRHISIIRELTKIHEECMVTTFEDAIEYYKENQPKGEYVLVIEGSPEEAEVPEDVSQKNPEEYIKSLMDNGMDKKTAIKEAAKAYGMSKRDVYDIAKEIPGREE